MTTQIQNPNVVSVEIGGKGTLSRSEDGSISFTPHGSKESKVVIPPFVIPGKVKIVPPSDISGRTWETVLLLGKNPPKSRVYGMKVPGESNPYESNRGQRYVVDPGTGDVKKVETVWIGTIQILVDKGYVEYHPTDSLHVWTLTDKGRRSVLPVPVTPEVPKVETK